MSSRLPVFVFLGTLVSVVILSLYQYGPWFFQWIVKLEDLYESIFVLRTDEDLSFRLFLQYAFVIGLGYVSTYLGMELRTLLQRVVYVLGGMFLLAIISPVLAFSNLIFEPFSGCLTLIFGVLVGTLYTYLFAPITHPWLRYFAGRVSKQTFDEMTHPKNWVNLHGKKELTVLNCRMLNYSGFVNDMSAEDLEKMGSLFLKSVAEFLVSRGAYLDTCNSQGVRVFIGFTDEKEDYALRACHLALELKQRLVNLEAEMKHLWHKDVSFGVSVATGELSLGLYGFKEFEFYSAVGDAVDYCRRICGLNELYGSYILIDTNTFQRTRDAMEVRPMEMVYSPRSPKLNEIYELLAEKGQLTEEELKSRDAFWEGVILFRKGEDTNAKALFEKAKLEGKADPSLGYYLDLLEQRVKMKKGELIEEVKSVRHARELKF